MKSPIVKVSRNAGMNLVARAIAKERLLNSIRDYRINIFMLQEGESCASDTGTMLVMVRSMMYCMKVQQRTATVEYRKLKAAKQVLNELSERGHVWRKLDTVTLDNALQIILDEFPKVSPKLAARSISKSIDET